MEYGITIYNNDNPLESVTFMVNGDEAAFTTYEKIREILETINGDCFLWRGIDGEPVA